MEKYGYEFSDKDKPKDTKGLKEIKKAKKNVKKPR
jgi:hypothetical protein